MAARTGYLIELRAGADRLFVRSIDRGFVTATQRPDRASLYADTATAAGALRVTRDVLGTSDWKPKIVSAGATS